MALIEAFICVRENDLALRPEHIAKRNTRARFVYTSRLFISSTEKILAIFDGVCYGEFVHRNAVEFSQGNNHDTFQETRDPQNQRLSRTREGTAAKLTASRFSPRGFSGTLGRSLRRVESLQHCCD